MRKEFLVLIAILGCQIALGQAEKTTPNDLAQQMQHIVLFLGIVSALFFGTQKRRLNADSNSWHSFQAGKASPSDGRVLTGRVQDEIARTRTEGLVSWVNPEYGSGYETHRVKCPACEGVMLVTGLLRGEEGCPKCHHMIELSTADQIDHRYRVQCPSSSCGATLWVESSEAHLPELTDEDRCPKCGISLARSSQRRQKAEGQYFSNW